MKHQRVSHKTFDWFAIEKWNEHPSAKNNAKTIVNAQIIKLTLGHSVLFKEKVVNFIKFRDNQASYHEEYLCAIHLFVSQTKYDSSYSFLELRVKWLWWYMYLRDLIWILISIEKSLVLRTVYGLCFWVVRIQRLSLLLFDAYHICNDFFTFKLDLVLHPKWGREHRELQNDIDDEAINRLTTEIIL